jgi:hypothetical protein
VQTYQIYVSNGRDRVHEIRSELFAFPEVLDVFVTGRSDSLVVVCRGRPRPAEWLRALRAVGYDLLPRRRSGTPARGVDRTRAVAPAGRKPRSARAVSASRAALLDKRVLRSTTSHSSCSRTRRRQPPEMRKMTIHEQTGGHLPGSPS